MVLYQEHHVPSQGVGKVILLDLSFFVCCDLAVPSAPLCLAHLVYDDSKKADTGVPFLVDSFARGCDLWWPLLFFLQ